MVWVTAEVDISLDGFNELDLVNELESRGYECKKTKSYNASDSVFGADLDRIDHLFACGQPQAAMQEILHVIGSAIGRNLAH